MFLWKNVVCRYGVPQVLVSDNGTQFASSRVRDFCKGIGIRMTFTSVEHPQSNGQAESANKVILSGLKKRVQDSGASWVDELPPSVVVVPHDCPLVDSRHPFQPGLRDRCDDTDRVERALKREKEHG
uniref:Pro-Pol polyprotein n=1 Tax=Cajanus cajan TaxID=3821 RepID=A0A151TWR0_CAJCA|nr:Pro-Pol polyprotein [Cajanus cajan]